MKQMNVRKISELSLLTAMMTILGSIKLPNLIPGVEFQLSAPLAVAICAVFGFRKYILCGCLSSLISLFLGTQNLLNVAIAMQFRLIVGFILFIGKNQMWSILLPGPIASAIARITVAFYLGKLAIPMVIMALPGMFFTMCIAPLFVRIFQRIPYVHTTCYARKG